MATVSEFITHGLNDLAQGKLDQAFDSFRQATDMDPSNDTGWMGMAMVHERRGEIDTAIQVIQKAIEVKPDEPLHYASLSRFYQRKGMIPEAETALARSIELQRGS